MNYTCKVLKFGSIEQLESIELRRKVLRIPLGLDFDTSDLEAESSQFHFAAFHEDELIAVLLLKTMPDMSPYILKMRQVAVKSEKQGKGVGKSLVRYSEKWAISNEYRIIELNARNTAVDFYISLGYSIIGDEFLELGIPHFKMYKNLI